MLSAVDVVYNVPVRLIVWTQIMTAFLMILHIALLALQRSYNVGQYYYLHTEAGKAERKEVPARWGANQ